jgi:hypothetical protein
VRRNKDLQYNRLLVHSTSMLAALPILAFFAWSFFQAARILTPPGLAWMYWLCVLLPGIWILIRGRIGVPVITTFVVLLLGTKLAFMYFGGLYMDPYMDTSEGPSRADITFARESGLDVYCNGIHLGTTPLTISHHELLERVEPVDSPPAQQRIVMNEYRHERAAFSQAPLVIDNYIPYAKSIGADQVAVCDEGLDEAREDPELLNEIFSQAKYWFEYKYGDYPVLCHIGDTGSMRRHGDNIVIVEFYVYPNIPSKEKHVAALLAALADSDYHPSESWLKHILQYETVLLEDIWNPSYRNPLFEEATQGLAKIKYGFHEDSSPDEIDEAWEKIRANYERTDRFFDLPLENLAVEMLAKITPSQDLAAMYRDEYAHAEKMSLSPSPDDFFNLGDENPAFRLRPVQYAARQNPPPELFNQLVYQHAVAGQPLCDAIAYYPGESVDQIILHGFREEVNENYMHSYYCELLEIRRPALERTFQRYISEVKDYEIAEELAWEYICARWECEEINQEQLIKWIYDAPFLTDATKAQYISHIQHPSAGECMANFRIEDVISSMTTSMAKPNTELDHWFCDCWIEAVDKIDWENPPENLYDLPYGIRGSLESLAEVIALIDTPFTIQFLKEQLQTKSGRILLPELLLRGYRNAYHWGNDMSHLAPLVEELENISDEQHSRYAAELLANIGTDQAIRILESWREDNAFPDRADTARHLLEQLAEIRTQQEELVRLGNDLIEGRILPVDLIPEKILWTWDGEQYVSGEKTLDDEAKDSRASGYNGPSLPLLP